MFDADKSTVVEVPSVKEGLDKIVDLPDFSAQLSDFQVRVPKLTF